MILKRCRDCGDEKPLDDFHRRSSASDGRQARCKACIKAYNDGWREKNAEKNREYQREWQMSDRRKVQRQANHFKRKYGLTMGQREEMIREQDGKCYLCLRDLPLHVDHDDATGVVRKMLCGPCNRGIGSLQHDAALLRRAALYIEEHGQ